MESIECIHNFLTAGIFALFCLICVLVNKCCMISGGGDGKNRNCTCREDEFIGEITPSNNILIQEPGQPPRKLPLYELLKGDSAERSTSCEKCCGINNQLEDHELHEAQRRISGDAATNTDPEVRKERLRNEVATCTEEPKPVPEDIDDDTSELIEHTVTVKVKLSDSPAGVCADSCPGKPPSPDELAKSDSPATDDIPDKVSRRSSRGRRRKSRDSCDPNCTGSNPPEISQAISIKFVPYDYYEKTSKSKRANKPDCCIPESQRGKSASSKSGHSSHRRKSSSKNVNSSCCPGCSGINPNLSTKTVPDDSRDINGSPDNNTKTDRPYNSDTTAGSKAEDIPDCCKPESRKGSSNDPNKSPEKRRSKHRKSYGCSPGCTGIKGRNDEPSSEKDKLRTDEQMDDTVVMYDNTGQYKKFDKNSIKISSDGPESCADICDQMDNPICMPVNEESSDPDSSRKRGRRPSSANDKSTSSSIKCGKDCIYAVSAGVIPNKRTKRGPDDDEEYDATPGKRFRYDENDKTRTIPCKEKCYKRSGRRHRIKDDEEPGATSSQTTVQDDHVNVDKKVKFPPVAEDDPAKRFEKTSSGRPHSPGTTASHTQGGQGRSGRQGDTDDDRDSSPIKTAQKGGISGTYPEYKIQVPAHKKDDAIIHLYTKYGSQSVSSDETSSTSYSEDNPCCMSNTTGSEDTISDGDSFPSEEVFINDFQPNKRDDAITRLYIKYGTPEIIIRLTAEDSSSSDSYYSDCCQQNLSDESSSTDSSDTSYYSDIGEPPGLAECCIIYPHEKGTSTASTPSNVTHLTADDSVSYVDDKKPSPIPSEKSVEPQNLTATTDIQPPDIKVVDNVDKKSYEPEPSERKADSKESSKSAISDKKVKPPDVAQLTKVPEKSQEPEPPARKVESKVTFAPDIKDKDVKPPVETKAEPPSDVPAKPTAQPIKVPETIEKKSEEPKPPAKKVESKTPDIKDENIQQTSDKKAEPPSDVDKQTVQAAKVLEPIEIKTEKPELLPEEVKESSSLKSFHSAVSGGTDLPVCCRPSSADKDDEIELPSDRTGLPDCCQTDTKAESEEQIVPTSEPPDETKNDRSCCIIYQRDTDKSAASSISGADVISIEIPEPEPEEEIAEPVPEEKIPEPEPEEEIPEPEPVKIAAEPEPVKIAAEPEPVKIAAEPEPVIVAAEPEPVKVAAEPEPVIETAEPEPVEETVDTEEIPETPEIKTEHDDIIVVPEEDYELPSEPAKDKKVCVCKKKKKPGESPSTDDIGKKRYKCPKHKKSKTVTLVPSESDTKKKDKKECTSCKEGLKPGESPSDDETDENKTGNKRYKCPKHKKSKTVTLVPSESDTKKKDKKECISCKEGLKPGESPSVDETDESKTGNKRYKCPKHKKSKTVTLAPSESDTKKKDKKNCILCKEGLKPVESSSVDETDENKTGIKRYKCPKHKKELVSDDINTDDNPDSSETMKQIKKVCTCGQKPCVCLKHKKATSAKLVPSDTISDTASKKSHESEPDDIKVDSEENPELQSEPVSEDINTDDILDISDTMKKVKKVCKCGQTPCVCRKHKKNTSAKLVPSDTISDNASKKSHESEPDDIKVDSEENPELQSEPVSEDINTDDILDISDTMKKVKKVCTCGQKPCVCPKHKKTTSAKLIPSDTISDTASKKSHESEPDNIKADSEENPEDEIEPVSDNTNTDNNPKSSDTIKKIKKVCKCGQKPCVCRKHEISTADKFFPADTISETASKKSYESEPDDKKVDTEENPELQTEPISDGINTDNNPDSSDTTKKVKKNCKCGKKPCVCPKHKKFTSDKLVPSDTISDTASKKSHESEPDDIKVDSEENPEFQSEPVSEDINTDDNPDSSDTMKKIKKLCKCGQKPCVCPKHKISTTDKLVSSDTISDTANKKSHESEPDDIKVDSEENPEFQSEPVSEDINTDDNPDSSDTMKKVKKLCKCGQKPCVCPKHKVSATDKLVPSDTISDTASKKSHEPEPDDIKVDTEDNPELHIEPVSDEINTDDMPDSSDTIKKVKKVRKCGKKPCVCPKHKKVTIDDITCKKSHEPEPADVNVDFEVDPEMQVEPTEEKSISDKFVLSDTADYIASKKSLQSEPDDKTIDSEADTDDKSVSYDIKKKSKKVCKCRKKSKPGESPSTDETDACKHEGKPCVCKGRHPARNKKSTTSHSVTFDEKSFTAASQEKSMSDKIISLDTMEDIDSKKSLEPEPDDIIDLEEDGNLEKEPENDDIIIDSMSDITDKSQQSEPESDDIKTGDKPVSYDKKKKSKKVCKCRKKWKLRGSPSAEETDESNNGEKPCDCKSRHPAGHKKLTPDNSIGSQPDAITRLYKKYGSLSDSNRTASDKSDDIDSKKSYPSEPDDIIIDSEADTYTRSEPDYEIKTDDTLDSFHTKKKVTTVCKCRKKWKLKSSSAEETDESKNEEKPCVCKGRHPARHKKSTSDNSVPSNEKSSTAASSEKSIPLDTMDDISSKKSFPSETDDIIDSEPLEDMEKEPESDEINTDSMPDISDKKSQQSEPDDRIIDSDADPDSHTEPKSDEIKTDDALNSFDTRKKNKKICKCTKEKKSREPPSEWNEWKPCVCKDRHPPKHKKTTPDDNSTQVPIQTIIDALIASDTASKKSDSEADFDSEKEPNTDEIQTENKSPIKKKEKQGCKCTKRIKLGESPAAEESDEPKSCVCEDRHPPRRKKPAIVKSIDSNSNKTNSLRSTDSTPSYSQDGRHRGTANNRDATSLNQASPNKKDDAITRLRKKYGSPSDHDRSTSENLISSDTTSSTIVSEDSCPSILKKSTPDMLVPADTMVDTIEKKSHLPEFCNNKSVSNRKPKSPSDVDYLQNGATTYQSDPDDITTDSEGDSDTYIETTSYGIKTGNEPLRKKKKNKKVCKCKKKKNSGESFAAEESNDSENESKPCVCKSKISTSDKLIPLDAISDIANKKVQFEDGTINFEADVYSKKDPASDDSNSDDTYNERPALSNKTTDSDSYKSYQYETDYMTANSEEVSDSYEESTSYDVKTDDKPLRKKKMGEKSCKCIKNKIKFILPGDDEKDPTIELPTLDYSTPDEITKLYPTGKEESELYQLPRDNIMSHLYYTSIASYITDLNSSENDFDKTENSYEKGTIPSESKFDENQIDNNAYLDDEVIIEGLPACCQKELPPRPDNEVYNEEDILPESKIGSEEDSILTTELSNVGLKKWPPEDEVRPESSQDENEHEKKHPRTQRDKTSVAVDLYEYNQPYSEVSSPSDRAPEPYSNPCCQKTVKDAKSLPACCQEELPPCPHCQQHFDDEAISSCSKSENEDSIPINELSNVGLKKWPPQRSEDEERRPRTKWDKTSVAVDPYDKNSQSYSEGHQPYSNPCCQQTSLHYSEDETYKDGESLSFESDLSEIDSQSFASGKGSQPYSNPCCQKTSLPRSKDKTTKAKGRIPLKSDGKGAQLYSDKSSSQDGPSISDYANDEELETSYEESLRFDDVPYSGLCSECIRSNELSGHGSKKEQQSHQPANQVKLEVSGERSTSPDTSTKVVSLPPAKDAVVTQPHSEAAVSAPMQSKKPRDKIEDKHPFREKSSSPETNRKVVPLPRIKEDTGTESHTDVAPLPPLQSKKRKVKIVDGNHPSDERDSSPESSTKVVALLPAQEDPVAVLTPWRSKKPKDIEEDDNSSIKSYSENSSEEISPRPYAEVALVLTWRKRKHKDTIVEEEEISDKIHISSEGSAEEVSDERGISTESSREGILVPATREGASTQPYTEIIIVAPWLRSKQQDQAEDEQSSDGPYIISETSSTILSIPPAYTEILILAPWRCKCSNEGGTPESVSIDINVRIFSRQTPSSDIDSGHQIVIPIYNHRPDGSTQPYVEIMNLAPWGRRLPENEAGEEQSIDERDMLPICCGTDVPLHLTKEITFLTEEDSHSHESDISPENSVQWSSEESIHTEDVSDLISEQILSQHPDIRDDGTQPCSEATMLAPWLKKKPEDVTREDESTSIPSGSVMPFLSPCCDSDKSDYGHKMKHSCYPDEESEGSQPYSNKQIIDTKLPDDEKSLSFKDRVKGSRPMSKESLPSELSDSGYSKSQPRSDYPTLVPQEDLSKGSVPSDKIAEGSKGSIPSKKTLDSDLVTPKKHPLRPQDKTAESSNVSIPPNETFNYDHVTVPQQYYKESGPAGKQPLRPQDKTAENSKVSIPPKETFDSDHVTMHPRKQPQPDYKESGPAGKQPLRPQDKTAETSTVSISAKEILDADHPQDTTMEGTYHPKSGPPLRPQDRTAEDSTSQGSEGSTPLDGVLKSDNRKRPWRDESSEDRTTENEYSYGKEDTSSDRTDKTSQPDSKVSVPADDIADSISTERQLRQHNEEDREETRSNLKERVCTCPKNHPCRPRDKSLYSSDKENTFEKRVCTCPKNHPCRPKDKSLYSYDKSKIASDESISSYGEPLKKKRKVYMPCSHDHKVKFYPQGAESEPSKSRLRDDCTSRPYYTRISPYISQLISSDEDSESHSENFTCPICRPKYEHLPSYQPSEDYERELEAFRRKLEEDENYKRMKIARAAMLAGISNKVRTCLSCAQELSKEMNKTELKMNYIRCTCAQATTDRTNQSDYIKLKQSYEEKFYKSADQQQPEPVIATRKYRIRSRSRSPHDPFKTYNVSSTVTVTARGEVVIQNITDQEESVTRINSSGFNPCTCKKSSCRENITNQNITDEDKESLTRIDSSGNNSCTCRISSSKENITNQKQKIIVRTGSRSGSPCPGCTGKASSEPPVTSRRQKTKEDATNQVKKPKIRISTRSCCPYNEQHTYKLSSKVTISAREETNIQNLNDGEEMPSSPCLRIKINKGETAAKTTSSSSENSVCIEDSTIKMPHESTRDYLERLRINNVIPYPSCTVHDTSSSQSASNISEKEYYSSDVSEILEHYKQILEQANLNRRICHKIEALHQSNKAASNVMKFFSDGPATSGKADYGQFYPYKSQLPRRTCNQPYTPPNTTASYPSNRPCNCDSPPKRHCNTPVPIPIGCTCPIDFNPVGRYYHPSVKSIYRRDRQMNKTPHNKYHNYYIQRRYCDPRDIPSTSKAPDSVPENYQYCD